MRDGSDRMCERCQKIHPASVFPYKGVDLCCDCWETEHGRTLHRFRETLDREASPAVNARENKTFSFLTDLCVETPNEDISALICPNCGSTKANSKGIRKGKRRYVCKKCRRSWTGGEARLSLPTILEEMGNTVSTTS